MNRVTNLARTHHYDHTLSWEDWGARILPAAAYFDYMNEQRGFKTAFDAAADQFERNYVQYVNDAKAALNGMFDPDDYPDVYDIRARFAFETIVSPLPPRSSASRRTSRAGPATSCTMRPTSAGSGFTNRWST